MESVWTRRNGVGIEAVPGPGSTVCVEVVSGRALTTELTQSWQTLQDANPSLGSPCFSPEFTQAVAAAQPDVEVAVVRHQGSVAGILPFERKTGEIGTPVGGIVSDYQGLISRPGFICDPLEL